MPTNIRLTDEEWEEFLEDWREVANIDGVDQSDFGAMLMLLKEHWKTLIDFQKMKIPRLKKTIAELEISQTDNATAAVIIDNELIRKRQELVDTEGGRRQ